MSSVPARRTAPPPSSRPSSMFRPRLPALSRSRRCNPRAAAAMVSPRPQSAGFLVHAARSRRRRCSACEKKSGVEEFRRSRRETSTGCRRQLSRAGRVLPARAVASTCGWPTRSWPYSSGSWPGLAADRERRSDFVAGPMSWDRSPLGLGPTPSGRPPAFRHRVDVLSEALASAKAPQIRRAPVPSTWKRDLYLHGDGRTMKFPGLCRKRDSEKISYTPAAASQARPAPTVSGRLAWVSRYLRRAPPSRRPAVSSRGPGTPDRYSSCPVGRWGASSRPA